MVSKYFLCKVVNSMYLVLAALLFACPSYSRSSVWSGTIASQLQPLRARMSLQSTSWTDLMREANVASNLRNCGCRAALVDNEIYFTMSPNTQQCNGRIEALLSVIARSLATHDFDDVEFYINGQDWPVVSHQKFNAVPVLSYCVNHMEYFDVALPFWSVLQADAFQKENIVPRVPWDEKAPIAIWRGTTTGGHYTASNWEDMQRTKIVRRCRENASVCDAGFTGFPQCSEGVPAIMQKHLGQLEHVDEGTFGRYKYIISVDGNGAPASRGVKQMFFESVLLKVDSPYEEFFYPLLRPWQHYVPVARYGCDLQEKISWGLDHDKEAKRIAANARSFGEQHLTAASVDAYVYELLSSLAAIARHPPTVGNMTKFVAPPHWRVDKDTRRRRTSERLQKLRQSNARSR